jgi:hypothetical protein
MEDTFDIIVSYKGSEQHFTATLLSFTYSYKIAVDVNGCIFWFERDNDEAWRGVMKCNFSHSHLPETELIHLIGQQIHDYFQ